MPIRSKRAGTAETVLYEERTEKVLTAQLKDLMARLGWTPWYHTHRSQFSPAGFPDVVSVHPGQRRLIFVELKRTDREKLKPDQVLWRDALLGIGAEFYVWTWDTPLEEIAAILRARPAEKETPP